MSYEIKEEEYGSFGVVNVGYISVNGRDACIIFDPDSNPIAPFKNIDLLEAYLIDVHGKLEAMPVIETPEPVIQYDSNVKKWRTDILWRKFTPEERVALLTQSKEDAVLEDFKLTMSMSPYVLSNDVEFLRAMSYIVLKEIITEERKNEIISGE